MYGTDMETAVTPSLQAKAADRGKLLPEVALVAGIAVSLADGYLDGSQSGEEALSGLLKLCRYLHGLAMRGGANEEYLKTMVEADILMLASYVCRDEADEARAMRDALEKMMPPD